MFTAQEEVHKYYVHHEYRCSFGIFRMQMRDMNLLKSLVPKQGNKATVRLVSSLRAASAIVGIAYLCLILSFVGFGLWAMGYGPLVETT